MTASHQLPLAAGWDGRSWRLQEVPVPAGSTGASLLAVSCLSAGFCEAVGYSAAANGDTTLAEIWDGTGWRAQLTPAFAPGLHVYLSGVSCASGRDCEAVGERAGATKGSLLPLLEEWNGRSWEVQPSPLVPKADGYASLSAVSCASPRACEAVGFDEATDGFAEVWDGRSWKLQPVPQPSGKGSLGYLYSVSCASPGTCVAVGFAYTAAPVTHAFVVAWDGPTGRARLSPPSPATQTWRSSGCRAPPQATAKRSGATATARMASTRWRRPGPDPPGTPSSRLEG